MTADNQGEAATGWRTSVGHVLTRLLLVVAGYIVATLIGLLAVTIIYGLLSSIPNAPDYFVLVKFAPSAILFLPGIALLTVIVTFAVTFIQALIAALLSEIFRLRNFALHMLFGALTSASGFALIMPTEESGVPAATWVEMAVVTAAGAIGGLVYWLIAGRQAGFRRD